MFADRVFETTTTTGTGAYTLGGAQTDYDGYADQFANGALVAYHCRSQDGVTWESGWGVLNTSAGTITRNLLSSSSGSLISWGAGTKFIYSWPASDILSSMLANHIGTARKGFLPAGALWPHSGNSMLMYYNGSADVPVLPLTLGSAGQVIRVNSGGTAPEWGSADGLKLGASTELTISSGSVVATTSHHSVDTQSNAASDDLDTITVTALGEGQLLLLKAENAARVVTVKHGTGNITLASGDDFDLDAAEKRILLQKVGSNLVEVSRSVPISGLVPLATVVASSDATVEFVDLPTADYAAFLVTVSNLVAASDAVNLLCRLRPVSGSFLSGGSDYVFAGSQATTAGSVSGLGSTATSSMRLIQTIGNASDEEANGEIRFSGFAATGRHKQVRAYATQLDDTGVLRLTALSGALTGSTAAVDGIQFLMSSGNIASGTFQLFGLKGA